MLKSCFKTITTTEYSIVYQSQYIMYYVYCSNIICTLLNTNVQKEVFKANSAFRYSFTDVSSISILEVPSRAMHTLRYRFTKGLRQNLNLPTNLNLEYNKKSLNYIQHNFTFQALFLFYWTMSFTVLTWSAI